MNRSQHIFKASLGLLALGCFSVGIFSHTHAAKAKKPKVLAAITQQVTKLISDKVAHIHVEVTTVVPAPYVLRFSSYSGISGWRTLSAKERKSSRGSSSTKMKQRFRFVLKQKKACKLTGTPSHIYYYIRCQKAGKCAYKSGRREKITIRLNSENLCSNTTVTVPK